MNKKEQRAADKAAKLAAAQTAAATTTETTVEGSTVQNETIEGNGDVATETPAEITAETNVETATDETNVDGTPAPIVETPKVRGIAKHQPTGKTAGARGKSKTDYSDMHKIVLCKYANWDKFGKHIANGRMSFNFETKEFEILDLPNICSHRHFGDTKEPLFYDAKEKKYDGVVIATSANAEQVADNIRNFYENFSEEKIGQKTYPMCFTDLPGDTYPPVITTEVEETEEVISDENTEVVENTTEVETPEVNEAETEVVA